MNPAPSVSIEEHSVVYSDGLTDAQNQREEMFGRKDSSSLIRQEAPSGSDALEKAFLKR